MTLVESHKMIPMMVSTMKKNKAGREAVAERVVFKNRVGSEVETRRNKETRGQYLNKRIPGRRNSQRCKGPKKGRVQPVQATAHSVPSKAREGSRMDKAGGRREREAHRLCEGMV